MRRTNLAALLFRLERPLPSQHKANSGNNNGWLRARPQVGLKARPRARLQVWVEGKVEGKAEALLCLLMARFGAPTASVRKRIRGANLRTLDSWIKRAVVAPNPRSVFNPPRPRAGRR